MIEKPSNVALGCGLALTGFALFSAHDALVKLVGVDHSIFQTIFFAGLFGYVPMAGVIAMSRKAESLRPNEPLLVGLRSLINLVAMISSFYTFVVLPLAEAYALLFATPLLVTVLAVPFLGERVGPRRAAAIVVGLIGIIVVLRPGEAPLGIGHVAGVVAAMSNAAASLLVRRLGRSERTAVLILYPMFAVTLAMGLTLPVVYQPMSLSALGLMALVGWLALLGQSFVVTAYRHAPASIVAPMQYSQMLWAVLIGSWFFAERPDGWVFAGSMLIIGSGLYIVLRESRVGSTQPVALSANLRPDAGPTPAPKVHLD